ncbi:MAG: SDR family oxidoreductase [Actinomycetota bacterium]|nr:SDR family oxidoreductase [Actinomycetota bacterium]
MNLEGKVCVITGGARGIGRATVEKCARSGARVAFWDLDARAGEPLAKALQKEGLEVDFWSCDVTSEGQVEGAVEAVLDSFGHIDALVNNAGINAYFDATRMTESDWDKVFAVDLKAVWLCSKHVLPVMQRAGSGSIVNISSIHAHMTTKNMFPYAAAKSGVIGLTRSLALDYGADNIRVNAVCPGWVRTHLVQEWIDMQPDPQAAEAGVLSVHPMGRIAEPAEIANFVAWLASDEASFMTGADLLIDGGLSARFPS